MKLFSLLTLTLLVAFQVTAQDKKTYTIERTENSPKIDGILDDEVWKTAQIATDFVEFRINFD